MRLDVVVTSSDDEMNVMDRSQVIGLPNESTPSKMLSMRVSYMKNKRAKKRVAKLSR